MEKQTSIPLQPPQGAALLADRSPRPQPFPYVHGGSLSAQPGSLSPDVLCGYRWAQTPRENQLYVRRPLRVDTCQPDSFAGLDTLADAPAGALVCGAGDLRFDFGVECAAWLEIDSPDAAPGSFTLSISEYDCPAVVNAGPQSPVKTGMPQRCGDTWRLELNAELYEGVRYGFLHVAGPVTTPFHITGVRLVCLVCPVNYEGAFSAQERQLERIWYTAAHTVRLNLRPDYFAAILMDRGDRFSWTGDAYPAQAAALAAFGCWEAVLHNLHFTSQHGNGIESYEMYWVFSLAGYYQATGDRQGVRGLLPQAEKRLQHALEIYDAPGDLSFFGWDERLGAGFENPNTESNRMAYRCLVVQALQQLAALLRELGESARAAEYEAQTDAKRAALAALPHWEQYGIHACADAINAGVLCGEAAQRVYRLVFADREARLSYSPFNQYFLLQAMARLGHMADALCAVRDVWGGQLEYGATSFFEVYRPSWNAQLHRNAPVPNEQAGYTSLCHPWSAGVLPWLNEYVLGVRPLRAGFARFAVMPQPDAACGGLRGRVPTPHGLIELTFVLSSAEPPTGCMTLTVPQGTQAEIFLPTAFLAAQPQLRLDGAPCSAQPTLQEQTGTLCVSLPVLGAGAHQLCWQARRPGRTVCPPWQYTDRLLYRDTVTGGDWCGRYGADGWLLCAAGPQGEDLAQLPSYLQGPMLQKVRCQPGFAAPAAPCLPQGGRSAGAWQTQDPAACMQTFTVDFLCRSDRDYRLTLYFADEAAAARSAAVELFALPQLSLAAPVQVVERSAGGVYLVYRCSGSVRIRIDQRRGPNAVLNALFFDPV